MNPVSTSNSVLAPVAVKPSGNPAPEDTSESESVLALDAAKANANPAPEDASEADPLAPEAKEEATEAVAAKANANPAPEDASEADPLAPDEKEEAIDAVDEAEAALQPAFAQVQPEPAAQVHPEPAVPNEAALHPAFAQVHPEPAVGPNALPEHIFPPFPEEIVPGLPLIQNRVGIIQARNGDETNWLKQLQLDDASYNQMNQLIDWINPVYQGDRPMFHFFRTTAILTGIQHLLNAFEPLWLQFTLNARKGGNLPLIINNMCSRYGPIDPDMLPLITSFEFLNSFGQIFRNSLAKEVSKDGYNNCRFQSWWFFHINETGMIYRSVLDSQGSTGGNHIRFVEQQGLTLFEVIMFFYVFGFKSHLPMSVHNHVFYYYLKSTLEKIQKRIFAIYNTPAGVRIAESFVQQGFIRQYINPWYVALYTPAINPMDIEQIPFMACLPRIQHLENSI